MAEKRESFHIKIVGETTDDEFDILAVDLIDATQFLADYMERRYPRDSKCLYSAVIAQNHS